MEFFENRLNSFKKWPHPSSNTANPQTLALAGFYYVGKNKSDDSVRCYICEKQLASWEPGDIPKEEHKKRRPDCPLFNLHDIQSRLATFINWPHGHNESLRAVNMAQAGFFFDPVKNSPDTVVCYACGCGLGDWSSDDDPLIEHKKRKPTCPALKEISRKREITSVDTFKKQKSILNSSASNKPSFDDVFELELTDTENTDLPLMSRKITPIKIKQKEKKYTGEEFEIAAKAPKSSLFSKVTSMNKELKSTTVKESNSKIAVANEAHSTLINSPKNSALQCVNNVAEGAADGKSCNITTESDKNQPNQEAKKNNNSKNNLKMTVLSPKNNAKKANEESEKLLTSSTIETKVTSRVSVKRKGTGKQGNIVCIVSHTPAIGNVALNKKVAIEDNCVPTMVPEQAISTGEKVSHSADILIGEISGNDTHTAQQVFKERSMNNTVSNDIKVDLLPSRKTRSIKQKSLKALEPNEMIDEISNGSNSVVCNDISNNHEITSVDNTQHHIIRRVSKRKGESTCQSPVKRHLCDVFHEQKTVSDVQDSIVRMENVNSPKSTIVATSIESSISEMERATIDKDMIAKRIESELFSTANGESITGNQLNNHSVEKNKLLLGQEQKETERIIELSGFHLEDSQKSVEILFRELGKQQVELFRRESREMIDTFIKLATDTKNKIALS